MPVDILTWFTFYVIFGTTFHLACSNMIRTGNFFGAASQTIFRQELKAYGHLPFYKSPVPRQLPQSLRHNRQVLGDLLSFLTCQGHRYDLLKQPFSNEIQARMKNFHNYTFNPLSRNKPHYALGNFLLPPENFPCMCGQAPCRFNRNRPTNQLLPPITSFDQIISQQQEHFNIFTNVLNSRSSYSKLWELEKFPARVQGLNNSNLGMHCVYHCPRGWTLFINALLRNHYELSFRNGALNAFTNPIVVATTGILLLGVLYFYNQVNNNPGQVQNNRDQNLAFMFGCALVALVNIYIVTGGEFPFGFTVPFFDNLSSFNNINFKDFDPPSPGGSSSMMGPKGPGPQGGGGAGLVA